MFVVTRNGIIGFEQSVKENVRNKFFTLSEIVYEVSKASNLKQMTVGKL